MNDSRAFQFVQKLAGNLKAELDLPAFPDVVRRLQAALLDDDTTVKDIVTLISSEPVLSARLMQMANSAAMNPSGTPVSSLNTAVNRLGFNVVRTVSTAFAIRQLSRNTALDAIRPELEDIWKTSNEVASICYAVAKQAFGRQPDEAMMLGLLHAIGRLYILMIASQNDPTLRKDPGFAETLETWQPVIGKAILESWGLPAHLCEAVENQDCLLGGTADDAEPLTRLLAAAKLRCRLDTDPALIGQHPDAEATLASLQLGRGSFADMMALGREDMESIQKTLAA